MCARNVLKSKPQSQLEPTPCLEHLIAVSQLGQVVMEGSGSSLLARPGHHSENPAPIKRSTVSDAPFSAVFDMSLSVK